MRVALRAIESARQAAEQLGTDSRAAHVGYHLIGPGRRGLESDVAHHPPAAAPPQAAACSSTPRRSILGSLALLTGLGVTVAVAAAGVVAGAAVDVDLGGRPRADPRQRVRGRTHAPHGPPDRQTVAAAATRPARRRAGTRSHHGDRAHPHFVGRGRQGSSRAPRGACARQHGPAHSLRAAHRLSRTLPSEHLPGEDEVLAAAVAAIETLNARYAPGTADRFYLFHRARRWNGERGRVDGLGAQARQDRGVQPAAAGRHRHQLHRAGGRPRDPAAHPLLHHARQ